MATLKEILKTPRFSELKLLNKNANIDVPIDTIEISETPDAANFVPANTLLITTGMIFKDDPLKLCRFIDSLHSLPSAGLAIKVGRFLSEIPPEVLAYADSLNFPLIQIPMGRTLGDISHKLLSYIWHDQTEQVFVAIEIQQKFANLMIKGASINTLINQLSSMIKQPILLLDSLGEISSISQHFAISSLLVEEKKQELILKLQKIQKEKKKQSFLFELTPDNNVLVTVFPIGIENYFPNLLVIFKAEQLPYPLSQFVIEQSLTVLSLSLYKEQTLKNKKRADRLTLFSNLLKSDSSSENTQIMDYQHFFNPLNGNYFRAVFINHIIPENRQYYSKEIDTIAYEFILTFLKRNHHEVLLFPTNEANQYVLLFQNKEIDLITLLENLHFLIQKLLATSMQFGIGDPINKLELFHFSVSEAKETVESNTCDDAYIFYNKIQGIKRIAENVSEEEMVYFCKSILKDLAYPENSKDLELRKTLATYLDNQCEITETAEALFVHRNTVKYRIDKCRQLFGQAVESPEFSLQLRVALFLSDLEN